MLLTLLQSGGSAGQTLSPARLNNANNFFAPYAVASKPAPSVFGETGGQSQDYATSCSWSHTTDSNTEILVVIPAMESGDTTPYSVTSVTFDGTSLTRRAAAYIQEGGTSFVVVQFWTLENPTAKTGNIVITWSSGPVVGAGIAANMRGVRIQAPEAVAPGSTPTSFGTTTDGTTLTSSVTTLTNNAFVLSAFVTNVESTQSSNRTDEYSRLGSYSGTGMRVSLASMTQATAGSASFNWTSSGTFGRASAAAVAFATFNLQTLVETARFNNTNSFYAPTVSQVGGGTQTLTPARYNNTNTFFTPLVKATRTLTPARFNNANTFYSVVVTQAGGTQTLLPSRYNNANTFYSATVTRGTVTLVPARFNNTNTFYSATVRNVWTIAPARYNNANTFFTPSVKATRTLVPARFNNTNTFYAPLVKSTRTLVPARYTNANTFYAPLVKSTRTLVPARYTNANTFYAPTVTATRTLVQSARFNNANTFYTPLVKASYLLVPARYDNANTFYPATLTLIGGTFVVLPPRLDNVNLFYPQILGTDTYLPYFTRLGMSVQAAPRKSMVIQQETRDDMIVDQPHRDPLTPGG